MKNRRSGVQKIFNLHDHLAAISARKARAVAQRLEGQPKVTEGELTIYPGSRTVTWRGEIVVLDTRAYELLELLVTRIDVHLPPARALEKLGTPEERATGDRTFVRTVFLRLKRAFLKVDPSFEHLHRRPGVGAIWERKPHGN